MVSRYITDPKEIYTLELEKLQCCFSELQSVGEGISELPKLGWRQVEHLRHLNFIVQEAIMTGENLLKIGS
jgi:hypothetical protein